MLLKSAQQKPAKSRRILRSVLLTLSIPLLLIGTYALQGLNNPNLFSVNWLKAEYAPILFWPEEHGHGAFGTGKSLLGGTFGMLPHILGGLASDNEGLPQLVLDVKFKDMRKIYQQRDEALLQGRLIQNEDSFVRGEIRTRDDTIPVKLRLKGDLSDHLRGRKWSFRIHTRKGEQFLGMRRFSVQHPRVREYQAEALYFTTLKRYGVLAPRYFYVDFMLNGEDLGIMAIEEHVSKELLESQSRREGAIIRFDETLLFQSPDGNSGGFGGAYDDFRNASVDAYETGKIMESPVLSKHLAAATSMLRSFASGEIAASDVFDAKTLGAYLAVSEVFGAQHAVRWHNQRFYVNPITLKLEPIGYDASLKGRQRDLLPISVNEPIVVAMLEDPLVRTRFLEVLQQIAADAASGELLSFIHNHETEMLDNLRTEFFYLPDYPVEELINRASALSAKTAAEFLAAQPPERVGTARAESFVAPVLAYHVRDNGISYLEFSNAIPHTVTLQALTASRFGVPPRKISLPDFPLTLEPRVFGAKNSFVRLQLPELDPDTGLLLQLTAGNRTVNQAVAPYYPAQPGPAIPADNIDGVAEDYPFMAIDRQTRTITIPAGTWEIPAMVFLPAGYKLAIEAGGNLRFGNDAGLVVRGSVQFSGTAEQPVSLSPAGTANDASWLGIAVMDAATPSRWQHVQVSHTRGMSFGPWLLMGGTNFYNSPVEIISSSIRHHHGEDGLNIINTTFDISDLEIEDTLSDGFDCDFCLGHIQGGLFQEIGTAGGGDAIDISLSDITIDAVRFRNISDKAVSVGEASRAKAINLDIDTTGTGAAAKDGSHLELEQSRIRNAKVSALMAYIKKPEFGAAEITARNLDLSDNRTAAVAQTGSRIVIDNEPVQTEDVDVDEMYETIMRPGLRRPPATNQGIATDAGT